MQKLPIWFERVEGFVLFFGTTGLYFAAHGSLWKYLLVMIAVDLSMLGYLAGPKLGAIIYNLGHIMLIPLLLIAAGLISYDYQWLATSGLIWLAHIGLDRALGLGLKYPDRFQHTSLS